MKEGIFRQWFFDNREFFDCLRDRRIFSYLKKHVESGNMINAYVDYLFSDYKRLADSKAEKFFAVMKQKEAEFDDQSIDGKVGNFFRRTGEKVVSKLSLFDNQAGSILKNVFDNPKYRNYIKERVRKNRDSYLSLKMDAGDGFLLLDPEYSGEAILKKMAERDLDEKEMMNFFMKIAGLVGVNEIGDRLNEKIRQIKSNTEIDERKIDRLRRIRSLFTIDERSGEAIESLVEFYQTKIKFEDYKVNELMNKKEVALLESLIGKDEKVLEMGCGTGRLISELAKSGQDISGYDYTKRHVQITKENLEKNKLSAKVFQGDWHNNALKDGSFDSVYSLGRNILHDYSVIDQMQLFKEAARILKPGGQFIFDIPNRTKGNYHELVEGYAEEMKKRGIQNFRYGSIYDSPDGKNFATRYAYSPEDIEQLAQLSGFEIAEVKKEKLETGKDDENLYFILKKKK